MPPRGTSAAQHRPGHKQTHSRIVVRSAGDNRPDLLCSRHFGAKVLLKCDPCNTERPARTPRRNKTHVQTPLPFKGCGQLKMQQGPKFRTMLLRDIVPIWFLQPHSPKPSRHEIHQSRHTKDMGVVAGSFRRATVRETDGKRRGGLAKAKGLVMPWPLPPGDSGRSNEKRMRRAGRSTTQQY